MQRRVLLITLAAVSLSILSGCATPFVAYQHTSNPEVGNDGLDLVCVGGEFERGKLTASGAGCQNVAAHGGQYINVEVRVRLK